MDAKKALGKTSKRITKVGKRAKAKKLSEAATQRLTQEEVAEYEDLGSDENQNATSSHHTDREGSEAQQQGKQDALDMTVDWLNGPHSELLTNLNAKPGWP